MSLILRFILRLLDSCRPTALRAPLAALSCANRQCQFTRTYTTLLAFSGSTTPTKLGFRCVGPLVVSKLVTTPTAVRLVETRSLDSLKNIMKSSTRDFPSTSYECCDLLWITAIENHEMTASAQFQPELGDLRTSLREIDPVEAFNVRQQIRSRHNYDACRNRGTTTEIASTYRMNRANQDA